MVVFGSTLVASSAPERRPSPPKAPSQRQLPVSAAGDEHNPASGLDPELHGARAEMYTRRAEPAGSSSTAVDMANSICLGEVIELAPRYLCAFSRASAPPACSPGPPLPLVTVDSQSSTLPPKLRPRRLEPEPPPETTDVVASLATHPRRPPHPQSPTRPTRTRASSGIEGEFVESHLARVMAAQHHAAEVQRRGVAEPTATAPEALDAAPLERRARPSEDASSSDLIAEPCGIHAPRRRGATANSFRAGGAKLAATNARASATRRRAIPRRHPRRAQMSCARAMRVCHETHASIAASALSRRTHTGMCLA